MDPMTMGALLGAVGKGGGGTKVSQSVSNQASSLVSFSTVTNVGSGPVTGTTAPGTTSQTATANASTGTDDSAYSPALGVFDTPTSVPDAATGATSTVSNLPMGWILAGVAGVVALVFLSKRKG